MRLIRTLILFVFSIVFLNFQTSSQDVIDFQIKGIDDGIKSSRDQDYQEALVDAKMKALEKAGVEVKSEVSIENYQVLKSYVESRSEALILPGMSITDLGYFADGTYQVFIVGKMETSVNEDISSKEIRYAKSLIDRGKDREAKEYLEKNIDHENEEIAEEALYYYLIWGFSQNPKEEVEKFIAYYPTSEKVEALRDMYMREHLLKNIVISNAVNIEVPTKTYRAAGNKIFRQGFSVTTEKINFEDYFGNGHTIQFILYIGWNGFNTEYANIGMDILLDGDINKIYLGTRSDYKDEIDERRVTSNMTWYPIDQNFSQYLIKDIQFSPNMTYEVLKSYNFRCKLIQSKFKN